MEKNKKLNQRLNRTIGQLEGIKKMLDQERECADILTQFKASSSALSATTKEFAKDQVNACFSKEKRTEKQKKDLENILNTIIKN